MKRIIIARAELAGYPGSRLHHNAKFSISVRKDYWNKKTGTSLMTEIIGCARKMNLLNIELEVVADNKAAIALYHKMGFSDVGVYRDYWFSNNVYSDAMQPCGFPEKCQRELATRSSQHHSFLRMCSKQSTLTLSRVLRLA